MPSKLTEADKELIRDLCHDKTDKELATMLGVSDRTIERERNRS
jgi:FixJ family two-component response regulator